MAATDVAICNMALNQISNYEITSLAGTSVEAVACNRYYAQARDVVLQSHPWSFAKKELTLTEDTTNDFSEWDYVYNYPSDCLAPREIYSSTGENRDIEYEVFNLSTLDTLKICTTEDDAILLYTAQVTDTTLFPPLFTQALVFYLAFLLVQPLHADRSLKADMLAAYQATMAQAEAADCQEENIAPDTQCDFVDAR